MALRSLRKSFAAGILLGQLDEFLAQADGVRHSGDTEFVHDMRVAGRKLRNSLKLFPQVSAGHARRWAKEIRRLTKALGALRDNDVQALTVLGYSRKLRRGHDTKNPSGIGLLLVRLEQRRPSLLKAAHRAMDRFGESGAVGQMQQKLPSAKTRSPKKPDMSQRKKLRRWAAGPLASLLDRLLNYSRFIREKNNAKELHAMRIAAKRLRYSLEACKPLLGRELGGHIERVRSVQAQLGEIHDCDVWAARLASFISRERGKHREFYGTEHGFERPERELRAFQSDRARRRRTLHRKFTAQWDRWEKERRWKELRELLL